MEKGRFVCHVNFWFLTQYLLAFEIYKLQNVSNNLLFDAESWTQDLKELRQELYQLASSQDWIIIKLLSWSFPTFLGMEQCISYVVELIVGREYIQVCVRYLWYLHKHKEVVKDVVGEKQKVFAFCLILRFSFYF